MGVAAAVVGGASAGAGLLGGIESSRSQERIAKRSLKQQERIAQDTATERDYFSQRVDAEAGLARDQLRAAEETRLRVSSMLGAPGTYGPGAVSPLGLSGLSGASGGIYGGSTTQTRGGVAAGRVNRPWEVSGEVMDPESAALSIAAQPQFAAVSAMVAEANQLMNREGPLWNQLNQSVVGSVYEGAAALQRQQMEEVSRSMARGGTARRAGLAIAQRFQVQENINRQRSTQLWQSRMALEQYRTQAAQQNISFANAWVDNQAGIRDSFQGALTNLRTFWSQTIPALAIPGGTAQARTQAGGIQAGTDALLAASNTKFQAISGAVETFGGAMQSVIANSNSTGSAGVSNTGGGGSGGTAMGGGANQAVASGQGLA